MLGGAIRGLVVTRGDGYSDGRVNPGGNYENYFEVFFVFLVVGQKPDYLYNNVKKEVSCYIDLRQS